MEENNITQQEENKVQDFITKIEVGNTNTDNSKNNQEAIRKFLIDQRLRYADAMNRASKISPYSAEYAEHSQTLNDVLASVRNLAAQKNAMIDAQQSFISDYENGLVSKANYLGEDGNKYSDAFTGRLPLEIDGAGNILFNNKGKKEALQSYVNYAMKDYATAQNILDLNNKLYKSGRKMDMPLKQMVEASLREQLGKGGRNTLLSLWTDNLVPGLDYKSIDKSYFNPENTQALFDLTVQKLSNGMEQVANQGYIAKQPKQRISTSTSSKSSKTTNLDASTGMLEKDRLLYLKKLENLQPGQELTIPNISLAGDPSPKNKRGAATYKIKKAADGRLVYVSSTKDNEAWGSGIWTIDDAYKNLTGKSKVTNDDGVTITPEDLLEKYSTK